MAAKQTGREDRFLLFSPVRPGGVLTTKQDSGSENIHKVVLLIRQVKVGDFPRDRSRGLDIHGLSMRNRRHMTNALSQLTVGQLKRAVEIKERIESLEDEINQILGAPRAMPTATVSAPLRGRKRFSAAARRKMAAAQRARRAAEKGYAAPVRALRNGKRRVSPAARARLSAAAKARWARAKAAGRSAL